MKIIKTTAGLILAVSLVFAVGCSQNGNQSTSNSKDSKTVTLGVQEGRKYTNSYFGLELNVPEGWYVASEEEKADLMQASQEVIAENNEDLAKKIDLSEEKVLYLLFASKYPLNHQGLNPNVMCMAENLGLLGIVSLKTGKDYLTASKTTIEQSGMPCAFGEISTEKLGGKTLMLWILPWMPEKSRFHKSNTLPYLTVLRLLLLLLSSQKKMQRIFKLY